MFNSSRPSFVASALLVSAGLTTSLESLNQEPLPRSPTPANVFWVQFPDGTTLRYQSAQVPTFKEGETISVETEHGFTVGTVRLAPPPERPRSSDNSAVTAVQQLAPPPAPYASPASVADLVLPPSFSETARRKDEFSLDYARRVVTYTGERKVEQEALTILSQAHAELSESWLGIRKPLPQMSLHVEVADVPAQGSAKFYFEMGSTPKIEVVVKGREAELPTVIRHETMHVVLRTHFGFFLPRWIDEGVATLVETRDAQHPLVGRLVKEFLPTNQAFSFFEITTKGYEPLAAREVVFYAQATSMVAGLVRLAPGKSPDERKQHFMSFVKDTVDSGADFQAHMKALAAKYPFKKVSEFQTWWVDDLVRTYLPDQK